MTQPHQPTGSVQRILGDIVELCELQWQLIAADSDHSRRLAAKAAIIGVVALITAPAALIAVMLSLGWFLREQTGWPMSGCFATVAAAASLLILLGGLWAARLIRGAVESLSEAKSEFVENLKWVKATVLTPKSSPRNQFREHDFYTQTSAPESHRERYPVRS